LGHGEEALANTWGKLSIPKVLIQEVICSKASSDELKKIFEIYPQKSADNLIF